MYNIFPYARQHKGTFPPELEASIRQGALKMIVFEELVYQDAERRKLTVSPAKLDQAMVEFRKEFKNPDDYKYFVKTEGGGSEQALRAKIQRSLLIDQVLRQEVQSKGVVSLAQAKAYYEKNPDQFRTAESFSIQTISIILPDKATTAQLKDAHKKAEDAYKQAKATKDYESFRSAGRESFGRRLSGDDGRPPRSREKQVSSRRSQAAAVHAARTGKWPAPVRPGLHDHPAKCPQSRRHEDIR